MNTNNPKHVLGALATIVCVGIVAIVLIATLVEDNSASSIGQVVVLIGAVVPGLLAFLKAFESVEQTKITRSQIDDVHRTVNGGMPTPTTQRIESNEQTNG